MLVYEPEDLDDVMYSNKFAYELALIAAQAKTANQAIRMLGLEFRHSQRVLVPNEDDAVAMFEGPEVSLWLMPDGYVVVDNSVVIQLNAI